MFDALRVRWNSGYQAVRDVRAATVRDPYRGFPVVREELCTGCGQCAEVCPSEAVLMSPLRIDMGRCVFCGECEKVCPPKAIGFSRFHKTAATKRETLVVGRDVSPDAYVKSAVEANGALTRIFGRSLALRQVSAGGCNGCEMELNACSNVNFDMQRFGITIVASPRHADGLIITGPVSSNMAPALEDAFHSTPDPKIVIAAGACAISGGVFQKSDAVTRTFFERHAVDLFVPGCPVHPLAVVNGILGLLGRGASGS